METVQFILEREEKNWIKKVAKCMVICLSTEHCPRDILLKPDETE